MIDISSFQNGVKNPCCSTCFCFKSKTVEGSHEIQKCFLTFCPFLSNCIFFVVATIFLA